MLLRTVLLALSWATLLAPSWPSTAQLADSGERLGPVEYASQLLGHRDGSIFVVEVRGLCAPTMMA